MGIVNIAPLDSYQSVIRAMDFNPDGIEIDVQLTKDGHLVAYHHEKLDGHTNGSGIINVNPLEEILNTHYTVGPLNNYTLLALDDFFENEPRAKDFRWDFDTKLYTNKDYEQYTDEFCQALTSLIIKHELQGQVFIESYSIDFIAKMKELDVPADLFYYISNTDTDIATADSLDVFGISVATELITENEIADAHNRNLRVMLFNTKNTQDNIDAVKKSPDFIITDNLKHLVSVLN